VEWDKLRESEGVAVKVSERDSVPVWLGEVVRESDKDSVRDDDSEDDSVSERVSDKDSDCDSDRDFVSVKDGVKLRVIVAVWW